MDQLTELFGATGHVTAGQECARAVLIFVYGWIAVRIVGRRVFGKWAALDIIVSIIIGSNLSRAITGSAPLWGTLASTALLLALHWTLAQLAARYPKLSHLIEGRAAVLAEGGRVNSKVMHRWSISEADVKEALRQRGRHRVEDFAQLVLEPSGSISALNEAERRP